MARSDEPPEENDPPAEVEEDTQESDSPSALPPAREPSPHELPDIYLAVGHSRRLDDKEIRSTFSSSTADFIQSGRSAFALRLHGSGVHRDFIDAVVLANVIEPLARASRWVGGSITGR